MLAMTLIVEAVLADDPEGKTGEPKIQGASVEPCPNDPEATCLHLTGTRLHRDGDPEVNLSGSKLEIHLLEGRGTDVFAVLPEDMEPRTHVIDVVNRSGSTFLESLLPGTKAEAVPGYDVGTHVVGLEDGVGGAGFAVCGQGFIGDGVIVSAGYRVVGATPQPPSFGLRTRQPPTAGSRA